MAKQIQQASAALPARLPIFPLHSVLYPGGVLPLKIFEQRYMEMAKRCLKEGSLFGVCLIARGNEVGEPAEPHAVGSSARIEQWDMEQLGVLRVEARGGQRFRIRAQGADALGLIHADVEWIAPEPLLPVPDAQANLLPLLRAIAEDIGPERWPPPHDFDDAAWVGYRYCEVLPIPALARQKLLELTDTISRLEIIQQYLNQRGVLS
ncbi:MAG: LON peptidase substrate-binding domain-containing protein [Rhodocyclaceae bacterium]|nr:LON peptidase substrate-binding domain-containing protein [Rhodocyclaceae bacterium]